MLDLVVLFNRFDGALIDKKILVVHNVVNVERAGLDGLRLLEVARCTEKILVGIIRDQKHIEALIAFLWGQGPPSTPRRQTSFSALRS